MTSLMLSEFFETELQDGCFDVITARASTCILIFTRTYQQRNKRLALVEIARGVPKFYHCAFVVLFFSADQATVMIGREGNTWESGFAYFIEEKFSYLNIATLGKGVAENSLSCAFSCLNNLACFSFNFAAFPNKAGKFTCEILWSDKYNNSEGFHPSETFHHFSIVVRNLSLNFAVIFGEPEC